MLLGCVWLCECARSTEFSTTEKCCWEIYEMVKWMWIMCIAHTHICRCGRFLCQILSLARILVWPRWQRSLCMWCGVFCIFLTNMLENICSWTFKKATAFLIFWTQNSPNPCWRAGITFLILRHASVLWPTIYLLSIYFEFDMVFPHKAKIYHFYWMTSVSEVRTQWTTTDLSEEWQR